MEEANLFEELQACKEDSLIVKKLINYAPSHSYSSDDENLRQWRPIFSKLIEMFVPSAKIEKERVLLASHAFFALLSTQSTSTFLKTTFLKFLQLSSTRLNFLDETYDVVDLEFFKLICMHGYLQVNREEIYTDDILSPMFYTAYGNAIRYTRHSYFAYKVLYMWLQKTMSTDFWLHCGAELEGKLETIIFSNWHNAINEISKQNSMTIFNMYLRIMSGKYDGFLELTFNNCVNSVSWQNDIKYVILAEVCELWGNVRVMTSEDFLLSLSKTLTKNYLRHAGTKVYISIYKKLNEDQWIESFGPVMKILFHEWESEENPNYNALQLLCKHWLEPAIKRYKEILEHLWTLATEINGYFLRSHLRRMASETKVDLKEKEDEILHYLNHKDEVVRSNGFAIICLNAISDTNFADRDKKFFPMKSFLSYNANSTTVRMRDGIVKYFKIYYANALRVCEAKPNIAEDLIYIASWLHEFFIDCFEIGACYQRKIFGLNLFKAVLSLTDGSSTSKPSSLENTKSNSPFQKRLRKDVMCKFADKTSLCSLLKLVLDSALDIRQSATAIVLEHFDKTILTDSEKEVLFDTALEYCNSSKFYNTESGAAVVTILANWLPLNVLQSICKTVNHVDRKDFTNYSTYSDALLNKAANQLAQMKDDILKAIVRNKPFYGALTALLKIAFQSGAESSLLSLDFIEKVLRLLEDAAEFFLSVLSSKSTNTEISSSFAEMGLAIDEVIKTSEIDDANYDELSLTPAHQVLISCIWMSLKVSCEIACEIGTLMYSDETVKQSADIIVTVLFRCRHKGVVESAGAAIGNLTKALCKEEKYADLPRTYVINMLENDAMRSLNITRRGAGLTIMFHKIVVSDNRRDRPLLHFAVQTLLDLLNATSETCSEYTEYKHDSPCARRLHFLRALVADKEIHAHIMPYVEQISLTCFRYLASEVWTIRNASLQLFGAIMPRLVGQSYGEAVLDFGTGYSINHFVTHYPVLAEYVITHLEEFSSTFNNFSSSLHLHSKIVHVLILLSKFSCGGCELIDYSSRSFILKAKGLIRTLFNDPVSYVRLLAAKAYAALTAFSGITFEVEQLSRVTLSIRKPNLLHGYLLTIKYLKEKLSFEAEGSEVTKHAMNELKGSTELSRLRRVLRIWASEGDDVKQPCYILETLFLQLSDSIAEEISVTDIVPIDQNVPFLGTVQPGLSQFIDLSTKLYADYIKRTNNVNIEIVNKILDSSCIDQSTAFLNHLSPCVSIFQNVLRRVLSIENNCEEVLFDAMINFVLETLKHSLSDIDESSVPDSIENVSVKIEENMSHSNLWRLKCILIILFSKDEVIRNEILSYVLSLSVHDEEHVRQTAVEFTRYSAYRFAQLSSTNKLTVAYCCLILLKDEISEIRETIAESLRQHVLPQISTKYDALQHDEVIYQNLLCEVMFNQSRFFNATRERNLHFIKLFTQSIRIVNATIENPFYHDDNPFYREESKFLNICFLYASYYEKDNLDERHSDNIRCYNAYNKNSDYTIEAKNDIQEKISFNFNHLRATLSAKYVDYLLGKQGVVLQEYSQ